MGRPSTSPSLWVSFSGSQRSDNPNFLRGVLSFAALALGVQVICLPGEAEQEVGGECAIYANPASTEKVEEKLREAFERCKNTDIIQTGVRHARGYTWQRSLEVHAQALIPKKD